MSGKKKKRIRPSSGQRIGRMSCEIYYANTLQQAIASIARAEALYRRAEQEADRRERAGLIDEAKGRIVNATRFLMAYLADNKIDVRLMIENLLAARAEEKAA